MHGAPVMALTGTNPWVYVWICYSKGNPQHVPNMYTAENMETVPD